MKSRLFFCCLVIFFVGLPLPSVFAANACTSTGTGNWNATTTWTGCGGGIPTVADSVTILTGHIVTVDTAAVADTLTINANAAAGGNGISINSGQSLAVTGAVTLNIPTAATTDLNVNAGTLTAGSIAIPGGALNRFATVSVSTGTVTVLGSITFSGTAARARYTSTGASITNIGGNFGSGGTLTTGGTGTFNFNGSVPQVIGEYTTYNNLQINNGSGGVTFDGTTPITTTIGGTLAVNTGTLDIGAVTIVVNGATTVSGTLRISNVTGAKTFNDITLASGGVMDFTAAEAVIENGNLTINDTSAITGTTGLWTFSKVGGGTIGGTSTGVLSLATATFTTGYSLGLPATIPTVTITGATLTNNSTLSVGASLAGTGQLTQGAGSVLNIGAASAVTTLDASVNANDVHYTNATAAQTIHTGTYHNLFIDKTGQTGTLGGAITVNDNLTVTGGNIADGGFQIIGNAAGTFTLPASSTLTLGTASAATSFPTLFTTPHLSLHTASAVNYNSNVAQAISNIPSYGNLTLTATAGVTKTAAGAITVNGNLTNGSNNTFDNGGSIVTVKGNATSAGTHTGTGKILLTGGSAPHAVSGTGSYNNVELDDSNGVTQTGITNIAGTFTITNGAWGVGGTTILVTGATSLSGTLSINNVAGTKTFGDITINSGGLISFSAAEAMTINGNLTVNGTGTITGTSGIWTFQKIGGGAIGGTAPSITILGVTTFGTVYSLPTALTVNMMTVGTGVNETNTGTLTINTSLTGVGTLTQGASTTLNLGGGSTITTLDASTNPNEVHYTNTTAAQTIKATTYRNLFIEKGTQTATVSGATNVLGNLTVTSGTLELGGSTLNVTGATDIHGTIDDNNNSGSATFGGLVTVHTGGNWTGNAGEACNFNFQNGFTFNGTTFSTGGGLYTFNTNNQSISGSSSIAIQNLVVTGIQLTNNSTAPLTVSAALSGTGEFIQGANTILKIGGASAITTLTGVASGNTVTYNGTIPQTVQATTYQTLDISQNSSKGGAYIDADTSGTVSVGDTRVAIGASIVSGFGYARGSIVAPGDTDIGTVIVLPAGATNLKKTGAAASQFVYGTDGAYTDIDANGTVSIGDIRISIGSTVGSGFGQAVGSSVLLGDTDIGTVIVLPAGATNLKKTGAANSLLVIATDGAYIDADDSGTISPDDIRVSVGDATFSGTDYIAGSIVASGDTDIGTVITLPNATLKKTGPASNLFVYGIDAAYIDADLSGTVSAGDIRIAIGNTVANGSDYISGSMVNAGDTDIGTSIVLPTDTNLKRTGSGGTTFAYDTVGINANTTVQNTLILGGAKLYTTAAAKIIIDPSGNVSRTLGYVVGNLQKHVNTGAASVTFENGSGNMYDPVDIVFDNVTAAGDLTASTAAKDHPNISTSGLFPRRTVNRYWTLINNGVFFDNYSATFHYTPADVDGGANPANFIVEKFDTGAWTRQTRGAVTANSVEATGLTSFSDFSIGEQPITTITSPLADGNYPLGQLIPIQVIFAGVVHVTGVPELALQNGGIAFYASGSDTNTLTFDYTVGSSDTEGELEYASTTALTLNGGTIQDANSQNFDLTLFAPGAPGSLSANKTIIVDTNSPVFSLVTPQSGQSINSVTTASHVSYSINEILASGTITVTRTGGTDDPDSPHVCQLSGTALTPGLHTIDFSDTVNGCSPTVNLVDLSVYTFVFSGLDLSDNSPASVTSTDVTLDQSTPNILALDTSHADGTFKAAEIIDFTVQYSEPVTVDTAGGTPTLLLNSSGSALYVGGSGTDTLTFRYTVLGSENSPALDYVSIGALTQNGATIKDVADNEADNVLQPVGTFPSLHAIVIDTATPVFSAVTPITDSGIGSVNAASDVRYTLSENVASASITVIRTGGATDPSSPHVCNLSGTALSAGTHTIDFSDTVNGCNPAVSLVDQSVYSFAFNATDLVGNSAVPVTATGVMFSLTDGVILAVSTTHADGVFNAGEVIDITVQYNAVLTLAGSAPSLLLNSGGTAPYVSGAGTDTLTFRYTVLLGENSSDLDYSSTTDLEVSGTIKGPSGNNTNNTLPAVGTFALAHAIVINTPAIPPPMAPPASSAGGGETLRVAPTVRILEIPSPLALPAGPGSVTYNYTVWNSGGQVSLTGVTVTDNKCTSPTLLSGDTNNNSKLDRGENWQYICTAILSETTTNTATVTASSDDVLRQAITATATTTVVVGALAPLFPETGSLQPLITIINVPSRVTPLPLGGGTVVYTYTVTNPGVIPIHDVVVADDKCGPISGPAGDSNNDNLLDSGESWIYTCQINVQFSTVSTATAQGQVNNQTAQSVPASAIVSVMAPKLPDSGPLGVGFGGRNLTLGTTGADVKALQQYLNAHGFPVAFSGAGSVGNETTLFGPRTAAALARFQSANNITPASGYFGPVTRAYIGGVAIQPMTTIATSFARDLTLGSTGADVKALQQYLNTHGFQLANYGPGSPGNETELFGNATRYQLIQFQKKNNITPAVGYFGSKTRAAIAQ